MLSITIRYYTLCQYFRVEIRHFHLEMVDGGVHRSPDYSLGKYDTSVIVRERGDYTNKSARIVKMIDYYTNGQYCDETKGFRNSEVHLQCCEGLAINNIVIPPNLEYQHHMIEKNKVDITRGVLKAIAETSICAYQLVVCTPLMCPDSPPKSTPGNTKGGTNSSPQPPHEQGNLTLSQVMQAINGACVVKMEDWWTYEICFGKGARQFHMNVEVLQDEKTGEMRHLKVVRICTWITVVDLLPSR